MNIHSINGMNLGQNNKPVVSNKRKSPAFGAKLITNQDNFVFPVLDYFKTKRPNVNTFNIIRCVKSTVGRFNERNKGISGKLGLTANPNGIIRFAYQTKDKKVISHVTERGRKLPVFMKADDFFSPDIKKTDAVLDGYLARFSKEPSEDSSILKIQGAESARNRITHSQVVPSRKRHSIRERMSNSVVFTLKQLGIGK